MMGYNLTGIGRLGVGTTLPQWAIDVEGSGVQGQVNAKGGYLVNGSAGTTGQALCSDGTALDSFCTFLNSAYYQAVAANGTAQTQRPVLNFSPRFTITDSASPAETTVDLPTSGVTAGSYTTPNFTVDAYGRITAASSTSGGYTSGNNANGYWIKDPTGRIHQWGCVATSVSTGSSVTFPTSFTTAASIAPNATSSTTMGDGIAFISIQKGTVTVSGFTIEVGAESSSDGMCWSADGY
jgi:hypothetical protein